MFLVVIHKLFLKDETCQKYVCIREQYTFEIMWILHTWNLHAIFVKQFYLSNISVLLTEKLIFCHGSQISDFL